MAHDSFSNWLSYKLLDLRIDDGDSVYGSYIRGILDSDDSCEEKMEAMDGLISGVCDQEVFNVTAMSKEILDKWAQFVINKNTSRIFEEVAIDSKLKQIFESHSFSTTVQERSNEQRTMKEAVLIQYNQISDDEEDDREVGVSQRVDVQKNTNSHLVAQAEKEKRQQAKIESQRKKDKDKEDREKQKQMKEERKEKVKRKAQKVERKR